MARVHFYHGENVVESYQAFIQGVEEAKKLGVLVIDLEGKTLTREILLEAVGQENFFVAQKILVVQNLLARPKSKVRARAIEAVGELDAEVFWWEGKKITPATLKLLPAGTQIQHFALKDLIWSLLGRLSRDNNNSGFAEVYQQTWEQLVGQYKTGASVYLVGMLLWQIQQLLDLKLGNFRGAPFQQTRLARQAASFTYSQLACLHTQLVELDYRQKTGVTKLEPHQEVFLLLTRTGRRA